MVKKYVKYDKCKCGNQKVEWSTKCKKCHDKKGGLRVSQMLQNERGKIRKCKKQDVQTVKKK